MDEGAGGSDRTCSIASLILAVVGTVFLDRARECRRRRGLMPNLVAVDFYDEGDVFEASRKLNRLPPDAEPQVRETS